MTAAALADRADETLGPLVYERNVAWWDLNVDASDQNERRRADAELALSNALGDSELFDAVRRAREGVDGMAGRRLEVLSNLMLPKQVPPDLRSRIVELEASVEARFSRHRGVVRGEEVDDVTIRRILRESDDVDERREAWEASKTVGAEVADDVRELARLRNRSARELGYRDWFALKLAVSELSEEKLLSTLGDCDRVTAGPFSRWKAALDERLAGRFGCAVEDLRPWHYADPFFQETPPDGAVDLDPYFRDRDLVALASRTFDGIGAQVGGVLGRSDLFPRSRKCQHAFCIDVDREGDVRVLANLTDTADSMQTLLHELGHAVYDLGYDERLPWLLRDSHLVTTEASALLFGSLAGRREWLEPVLELDPADASELEARLRAARAAELLVFTRWVLVMTGFERQLYADPEDDLDMIWWELVSRHQLLVPPDGRRAPDWAAKIHVAVAPVYYHTYLYGTIVALQLYQLLEREAGGLVDRPQAARRLVERLYEPGLSVRWDGLVERVTGRPLSVDAVAREVAGA